jgi:hypothetical protein
MFRHVVLFRWLDGTTDEQRRQVEAELAALPPLMRGLREYRFGHDAGVTSGNADFAIIADFDDVGAYLAYRDHPAHQDVVTRITRPLTRERMTVQLEL